MSGHSKWSTIKRKKGAADAKRGKIFTKLIKEITIAARMGGGDPSANAQLRTAIANAKANNMPKENIEKAIKRGTGELEGVNYEEITYEGIGPGGVAMLVRALTDNKKRTVAAIRHILEKHNGSLGSVGSSSWQFEKKGVIVVEREGIDADKLMEVVIDAGAEDLKDEPDSPFEIITSVGDFDKVRTTLESKGIPIAEAEIKYIPKSLITLTGKDAELMAKLRMNLDDDDDVQNVYDNADIPDEIMEAVLNG